MSYPSSTGFSREAAIEFLCHTRWGATATPDASTPKPTRPICQPWCPHLSFDIPREDAQDLNELARELGHLADLEKLTPRAHVRPITVAVEAISRVDRTDAVLSEASHADLVDELADRRRNARQVCRARRRRREGARHVLHVRAVPDVRPVAGDRALGERTLSPR